MEFRVVWPVDVMGELMQHGIKDLLEGQKLGYVAGISKP